MDPHALGLPGVAFLFLKWTKSPRELKPFQVLVQPHSTELKEVGGVLQPEGVLGQFLHIHGFAAALGDQLPVSDPAFSVGQIQDGQDILPGGQQPGVNSNVGVVPQDFLPLFCNGPYSEMKLLHPLEGVQWIEIGRITVVQEPSICHGAKL